MRARPSELKRASAGYRAAPATGVRALGNRAGGPGMRLTGDLGLTAVWAGSGGCSASGTELSA